MCSLAFPPRTTNRPNSGWMNTSFRLARCTSFTTAATGLPSAKRSRACGLREISASSSLASEDATRNPHLSPHDLPWDLLHLVVAPLDAVEVVLHHPVATLAEVL